MLLSTPLSPTTLSTNPHTYLHTELYARRKDYLTPTDIRIKVSTWNVASLAIERDIGEWIRECESDERPRSRDRGRSSKRASTRRYGIGELLDGAGEALEGLRISQDGQITEKEGGVDIYVLGLQEIVDVTAPENYLRPTDPKIPLNWKAHVQAALPVGYKLIASPQLIGLLSLVYASPRIQHLISSVSTCTVGTGLMGYGGNKGAAGVRLVLGETTRLVLINCHLAAMQNGTDRRNWDHNEILRRMTFDKVKRDVLAGFPADGNLNAPMTDEKESMNRADLVIWCGDLNYRIELPNDDIRSALESFVPTEFPPTIPSEGPSSPASYVPPKSFNFPRISRFQETQESLEATIRSLLVHDQLYKQQQLGKSFKCYKEGKISFLPTYKYDVGTLGVFDSSEKQRAPSYCDRILWQLKDEDEIPQEGEETGNAGDEHGQPKTSFDTIGTLTGLGEQTDKQSDDEGTPKPVEFNRRRATTLTVEDEEDGGEDLIVSPADNIIPHLPPPPEDQEIVEDPPVSFPQNAALSSSSASGLKLNLITYTSHQTIRASDHKPVTAIFSLSFPAVNDDRKSDVYAEVAKEVDRIENERRPVITVIIDREGEASSPARPDYCNEDMSVSLGEVRLGERVERKLTVANTGLVPATCSFRKRPIIDDELGEEKESICKHWLEVDFDDDHSDGGKAVTQGVKLEPGEVVTVYLCLLIEMSDVVLLQRLNKGDEELEDILVLHVENGRDTFIPVSGQWMQSCFGRSLQELVSIPEGAGGARSWFSKDRHSEDGQEKKEMRYSAPRELYRITEYLLRQTKDIVEEDCAKESGVENQKWYSEVGWPFVKETWGLQYNDDLGVQESTLGERRKLLLWILECLSQDKELEVEKWEQEGYTAEDIVEVAAECLLGFLGSLDGRVIPQNLYEVVIKGGAGGTKEWENVLESLPSSASPIHANVFIYLTGFVSEMFGILSTNNPEPTPLTRSATTDTVASTTSKSNRSSIIKTNVRQILLKQRLAGIFAEVMVYRPPPAVLEKDAGPPNRQSVVGAVEGTGALREKKGDEERRRAFLVHFVQF